MNILFLLGLTVLTGTLCGKLTQRFKIPQVTGYIVAGLILGQSGFKLWTPDLIDTLSPLTNLVLGMIGFMLGAELKLDLFKSRGKSIYSILFAQGISTFLFVAFAIYLVTGKLYLAILLGAIATATDPAATSDVLWESKSRGPMTSSLLAIVALDDMLALVIYAFAVIFAKMLISQGHFSFGHLAHVFYELGLSGFVGIIGGTCFYALKRFAKNKTRTLPYSLGILTVIVGVATYLKIDLILATMISGVTLANIGSQESKDIFESIKKFSVPIFIIFFALVGARLDAQMILKTGGALILVVYVLSRAFGKVGGSFLGGIIGGAKKEVTKYLGFGLFSQAGVAIGMAISISHNLSHVSDEAGQIGLTIVNIAVATTFLFQLIGPYCVRVAASKAGEVGRDVTEEDIIESFKVKDIVEEDIPIIREDMHLNTMVDIIKKSELDDFCVVDDKGKLLGSISVGDLRAVLMEKEMGLDSLILPRDIAVPANFYVTIDRPLKEAIEVFKCNEIDFLPVLKDKHTKELVGIIRYREAMSRIRKELLHRRGNT
ncbi:MAG: cation:proton antiporter [Candidatus Zapsychrus exili]|nr:cation:proton antiporter [Candidatus Zapsychrus exili]